MPEVQTNNKINNIIRNRELFGSTPQIHKRFSGFYMVFQILNFSQTLVFLKQFRYILCSLHALPLSFST